MSGFGKRAVLGCVAACFGMAGAAPAAAAATAGQEAVAVETGEQEMAESARIEADTLEADIDAFMEEKGLSGLVFVRIDGETRLLKPYGMANSALDIPMAHDSIFGIGSRPIDFTIAAIFLLEKQGKLALSDRLDAYFPGAPADRAGMTIADMLNGRSGLPDFPANEADWDHDLGWIDRAEFERRTMAVPLLFAPGEGEAHSHWAFGLLAAIVERVSGKGYSDFLRENFFDPAGMARTGDYGESRGLALTDFADGGGVRVGLPNIPPNWGPTSWLVMGSGGMFSTLGDLRRFYAYVTRPGVLDEKRAAHFLQPSIQLDGSERGFELISVHNAGRSSEAYIFISNATGPGAGMPLVEPLEALIVRGGRR